MKGLMKSKKVLLMAAALTIGTFATDAKAQTVNMTADADVLNTLTLTPVLQLNFGRISAIRDTVNTATATIDTAGALATASNAPAIVASVDPAAVSQAQITIADGAAGAAINITIDNVIDPVNGGETFVLDQFTTSYNGAGPQARVIATPFAETFVGPTDTINIGATITTTTATAGAYADGVYAGTYDMIFSY